MKQYQLVASIIRQRGVKGEVEVHGTDGLPLNIRPNSKLYIVPPLLEGVRITSIVSVRGTEQAPWLKLEGVNDRNAATLLIGRYLLAAVEDCLVSDQVNETYVRHDWLPSEAVGLEVFDSSKGFIGMIIEESRATPQVLWTLDGPFGQVLLPAVDAFIKSFDGKSVQVQIPEGLLELNK